jgi:hypothetical protein
MAPPPSLKDLGFERNLLTVSNCRALFMLCEAQTGSLYSEDSVPLIPVTAGIEFLQEVGVT